MGILAAFLLSLAVPAAAAEDRAITRGSAASDAVGAADLLGIPLSAPWQKPTLERQEREDEVKKKTERAKRDKELYRKTLRADLGSIERWRAGLLGVLRFARSRPQVFPPQKRRTPVLFKEYRDEARKIWLRAMDYYLALDGISLQYGGSTADRALMRGSAASDVLGAAERRAAFGAAYAAYLAQARFAGEWVRLASFDEQLEKLFDAPLPELGLPEGSFSRLKRRFRGPDSAREGRALAVHYKNIGGSKGLRKLLGKRRGSWDRRRREDAKALPRTRARPTGRAAAAIAKKAFRGAFPLISSAGHSEGIEPAEEIARPILLPIPDWTDISISSRIAYALDTLKYWFSEAPMPGSRPEALITSSQLLEVSDSLLPGDILLVRRGRHLSDIGLVGYWHHAGLYLGTSRERAKFFGTDAVDSRLATARYRANVSTAASRLESPAVVEAGPRGVGFQSLSKFAAADSLAILRPRFTPREKAAALLRALRHYRKPYDFLFDLRTDDKLASAELVARAYQREGGSGLTLPAEEISGRWALSSNSLARKFDAEYGTERQQLDWILFLDGNPDVRRARFATLEEFRGSWRRPKWKFREASGNEPRETH